MGLHTRIPAGGVHIDAPFPVKFAPLLQERKRFKVYYGGRGGAKSWAIARALLIRGLLEPGLRVLCTREVQSSLEDSVHKLLKDQIALLGMGIDKLGAKGYRVLKNAIRGPGGTEFIFKGLSDPDALKSTEGADVVWVEEAHTVTKVSWDKLIPTVRKSGSEIWISFNPELEIDETYKRFVLNPSPRALVVKVNWSDNPWLTQELRDEMLECRERDYDDYLNIWEGFCKAAVEGAVYAKELRLATKQNRICRVPLLPNKPVTTFWDLGRADATAIWFTQLVGLENRIPRYYENNGEHIDHYIEYLRALERDEGYIFGTCWLPHDADQKRLNSRRTSRQMMEDAGFKVMIVPNIGVSEGIQAARGIFPNTYFDEQHAADGVNALRMYHFDVKDKPGVGEVRSKNPVHDWSSNGADAFRMLGVALRAEKPKDRPKPPQRTKVRPSPRAWMAR